MDLGFLKWKDPFQWTETSRSQFQAAIQREKRLSRAALQFIATPEQLHQTALKFQLAVSDHAEGCVWEVPHHSPFVLVKPILEGGGGYEWTWIKEARSKTNPSWIECAGMDVSPIERIVVYTADTTNDKQDYRLFARHFTKGSLWSFPKLGGYDVAILGHRVFFLEATAPLKYTRLVSIDLLTGKGRKIIYNELNPEVTLELVKGEGKSLYLMGYRAGIQTLYTVTEAGDVIPVPKVGSAYFPVGTIARNNVYFIREGGFDAPWTVEGVAWKLGKEIPTEGIEFCNGRLKLLVTKFYGVRRFWKLSEITEPKLIHESICSIVPNPWTPNYGLELSLWLTVPGSSIVKTVIKDTGIEQDTPSYTYATCKHGTTISKDAIPVRWTLLTHPLTEKPKGLVLVAYGAYGIPLSLNMSRWRPWIERGWAVALLFIRGGGDGNEMWADLGRMGGRHTAIEDVEACCVDLQRLTGCEPHETCIYGRSAGGLIVGNLIAKYPMGGMTGIAYAEVPYVDLLKTAANPDLPLTEYEYGEFAKPAAGPAEFEEALSLSPIHMLGPEGTPGVKVVCRTGLKDIQVYPYESLKWILSLRGGRKGVDTKYLLVENEGHVSQGMEASIEKAEDFLLIHSFLRTP
jgi:hypothetical protein